ncbi:drug/metabolite exporter YedA [Singulisphaera sp. Ch08]|uniref:Drug/metabolite exporter YedA n=1 Tax=Singulisphaera sp. Ch08 TaxID=3120278 RepID=A0AAU7CKG8_9BACT
MRSERKKWLTIAAFAVVYLVWGSTYLAIRFGLQSMPPLLMAGSRFLVAGTILCGWALARGASLPTRGQWLRATVAGILMLVLGNGCVTWAEQYVPSGIAALLVASEPFWLVLTAWGFFGGRRPGLRTSAGLMIGLMGVGLLVTPEGGGANGAMLAGSLAIILAAFAWAVGSLYLRRAALPESPALSTGMQMLSGGAILAGLGLLRGEAAGFQLSTVTTTSVLAWLYLIGFGSILAFTAYIWLLTETTPARLSTYAYVNPVVAVLLGSVVAHEPIAPLGWAAMVVIVASVALVTTGEQEEDVPGLVPVTLGEQT